MPDIKVPGRLFEQKTWIEQSLRRQGSHLTGEIAEIHVRPFTIFDTEENLWAAFQLARRLCALSSAIKYKTQMQQIEAMREEYATAVPGLLLEFLDANPLFH